MSLNGYFGKRGGELRMPRGKDSLGIVWEGPVLEGRASVAEGSPRPVGPTDSVLDRLLKPEAQSCDPVEYDAVLRAHCRLSER